MDTLSLSFSLASICIKHIHANLTSYANVHLMWNKAEINFTAVLIEKYKIHMFA